MVEEKDILLTAEGLLRTHGDKAAMECAQMVDRLERRRDLRAADVWRRILEVVKVKNSRA